MGSRHPAPIDTSPIEPIDDDVTGPVEACWGIQAVGANDCPYTGRGITVAVLDSGIDADHPAFTGIELTQKNFTGSGAPNHCPDEVGHGTHIAGTLFGRPVDGVRIGVAPGVRRALIGKIYNGHGGGTTAQIYKAIHWAAELDAHIICLSTAIDFVGYLKRLKKSALPRKLVLSKALADYRDNVLYLDRMVAVLERRPRVQPLLVAAAGNDSQRHKGPNFELGAGPLAAADGVVAVGALSRNNDQSLRVTAASNADVDVVAPGSAVYSAKPGGGCCYNAGTSMAAPHVAGVAALWAEKLQATRNRIRLDTLRARLVGRAGHAELAPGSSSQAIGSGLVRAPCC